MDELEAQIFTGGSLGTSRGKIFFVSVYKKFPGQSSYLSVQCEQYSSCLQAIDQLPFWEP